MVLLTENCVFRLCDYSFTNFEFTFALFVLESVVVQSKSKTRLFWKRNTLRSPSFEQFVNKNVSYFGEHHCITVFVLVLSFVVFIQYIASYVVSYIFAGSYNENYNNCKNLTLSLTSSDPRARDTYGLWIDFWALLTDEAEEDQNEEVGKDLGEASQRAWEEALKDLVFRLLVPYHLVGVVGCQEVGTVNEAALVEDRLDLMALVQEEAEVVVAYLVAQVA